MKRKIINQRKVKKILRNLISRFQELLAVPAVKPLLLLIISICILLIPVPYFITKISRKTPQAITIHKAEHPLNVWIFPIK